MDAAQSSYEAAAQRSPPNGHHRQLSSSTHESVEVANFRLSASPDSASGTTPETNTSETIQRGRGQANYPASNLRSSTVNGESVPTSESQRATTQLHAPEPNTTTIFRSKVTSQPTRPHATGEIPNFAMQPVKAFKNGPQTRSTPRSAAGTSAATATRNTSTPVSRAVGFVSKPLSALASSMSARPTRSSSRFSYSSAAVSVPSAQKPVQRSEESQEEDSSSSSDSEAEKALSAVSRSQVPLGQRAGGSKRSISSKTKRGSLGAFGSQK